MPPRPSSIHLTEALVRARHPRPGPDHSHAVRFVDAATIEAALDAAIADNGRGRSLWLFAYGSLLWHPECRFTAAETALVRGWHRRFCLWQHAFRGTRDRPCLMLALDAGGACRGVAYRVPARGIRANLLPVFRRELRGDGYRARWVRVRTARGDVDAVTFVANRAGARYAGRLDDATVARTIAEACGAKGPCADYLRRAVESLAERGIRDSHLWRVQRLVAARMRRACAAPR